MPPCLPQPDDPGSARPVVNFIIGPLWLVGEFAPATETSQARWWWWWPAPSPLVLCLVVIDSPTQGDDQRKLPPQAQPLPLMMSLGW